jgi:hypothetical protein
MKVHRILRNLNKRTINTTDVSLNCPTCDYPISNSWIENALDNNNYTIYYKNTVTKTNTNGEKVQITEYSPDTYEGTCPAYIELTGYCYGTYYDEDEDGEEIECDCERDIVVRLYIAGVTVD